MILMDTNEILVIPALRKYFKGRDIINMGYPASDVEPSLGRPYFTRAEFEEWKRKELSEKLQ